MPSACASLFVMCRLHATQTLKGMGGKDMSWWYSWILDWLFSLWRRVWGFRF
jgi:hypothetical protein